MHKRPRWILLLMGAAALFAGVVWFSTLQQPLIDKHEFRQTQTALSALFMKPGLDGLLNYQTPVLGAPWSIPFELPLFQWLSHQLAIQTGLNLSSSGRLLSVLFGLGCLWPAIRLMRRFDLSFTATGLFIALYCTSSIYLYWNRTFLMESTALFCTLISLDCYSKMRNPGPDSNYTFVLITAGFTISLSLGLLVKATTALPALILMGGDWIWQSRTALIGRQRIREQTLVGGAMALAFATLSSWTRHADALKQLNPVGLKLTSTALKSWNFGQPAQRLQAELWHEVVLQRMLTPIGALPIILLLAAGLWMSNKTVRSFLLASLFLALAPLLIFTNLHIVHTYYQTSNQIFLLMALAGSTATVLEQGSRSPIRKGLTIAALSLIISSNLGSFFNDYWPSTQKSSSEKLMIGKLIQKYTPGNSAILAFDKDWSSALAYHSQRHAFTKPAWRPDLSEAKILADADQILGGLPLGAVVSRQPINETILQPKCSVSMHRTIKKWHLYICEPIKTP